MQFLKGHPSTLMDDYQLNITSMIKYAARNFPDREIVSNNPDGMFRYNYKEALTRIKRLANALTKLGVKPGDRVGVLGWNTHRFFELYFGIAGIGAVLLQMNFRTSREELNDPRTSEAFTGGYWRSGDSATIDCHGYVKLIDRIKDLIKSGGEWISSVDLENAIMGYSKVFEATVVGVYHPKWEERPVAFVVVNEEFKGKVTKEEIINFIVPKFARWQLPDDIVFLNELPKTSVGKFNKKVLREEYRNYLVVKSASEPLE